MVGGKSSLSKSRERFFSQTPGQKSGVKLRPKQKFALIRKIEKETVMLCMIANVSRSGYYRWLARADEPEKDYADYLAIKEIFEKGKSKYGWRTIQMKLKAKGILMNHKKIQRIKIKYRLFTKIRRINPYKTILRKNGEHRIFENKLDRNFRQTEPQRVFCTDITYLPFNRRLAYLSTIKDIATREIVAWNASMHLEMDLVLTTVKNMKDNHAVSFENSLIHSDQGFHYTNPAYGVMLKELRMVQSMSRKGNCIDNAPMESFFGHFKDEVDYKTCGTFTELRTKIAEYMDYYNNERQQWELKKMTPVEYRNHLLATV